MVNWRAWFGNLDRGVRVSFLHSSISFRLTHCSPMFHTRLFEAARMLGIARQTLRLKLRDLGMHATHSVEADNEEQL
jgi:hypothetical protein